MLTAERLRELLTYDRLTGDFYWRSASQVTKGRRVDLAGRKAGTVQKHRVAIWIGKRSYSAHRLAWLYEHDVWPAGWIDHINRNPLDNRIDNLRVVTRAHNVANSKVRSDCRSGKKGVSPVGGGWIARMTVRRRPIYLGFFKSAEDAAACFARAHAALYGGV
jgi:hypothetical protein